MMELVLGAVCLLLATAVVLLVLRLRRQSVQLREYSRITDVEAHIASLKSDAAAFASEKEKLKARIQELKRLYAQYTEVVGICRNAVEATQRLDEINAEISRLGAVLPAMRTAQEAQNLAQSLRNEAEQLRGQIVSLADELAMEEVGLYRRRHDFDDPETFKSAIDANLRQQKDMVRANTACVSMTTWVVEGSEAKGRKMMREQIKLMLRAFNGECDAAISSARATNFPRLVKRIQKTFQALNKLGATKQIAISDEFLQLKLDELQLTYEMELKKQEFRQKQPEVRAQMEEEARAEREIEEAERKAEVEERAKAAALEEARRQLAEEHGRHNEKLQQLVAKLETELSQAIDRKAKAIARAQLTRSGHVYVLSNIGSFGKNCYKIGMTRRLEPLMRVDELGDASVPFPFDVHAMIYSEDAPALEYQLHRCFDDRRLNLVNTRKEFFNVSLEEIQEAVARFYGQVTVLVEHPATEYRESLAIRREKVVANVA